MTIPVDMTELLKLRDAVVAGYTALAAATTELERLRDREMIPLTYQPDRHALQGLANSRDVIDVLMKRPAAGQGEGPVRA